jgi:hypothetical protein
MMRTSPRIRKSRRGILLWPSRESRGAFQLLDLGGREIPEASGPQAIVADRSDRDPSQPDDRMADGFAHPTHLAIAAFADADQDYRLVVAREGGSRPDVRRRRAPAVEHDAVREPVEDARLRHAAHAGFVEAFDAMPRVRQARRQLAVVGQQQQAFRVVVESPDRIDALADAAQQIHDGRPALRIDHRGHESARLVEQQIAERLAHGDAAAVDADVVPIGIGFRAELAHHGAVHADTALAHQVFRRASRADAGGGENFLKTVRHGPPAGSDGPRVPAIVQ